MSEKELKNQNCENCELEHNDKASKDAVKVRTCQVYPDCDIEEAKDNYIVRMDMPGLDPAHIDVKLDKDILTVEANAAIEGLAPRRYFRQFRVMRGLDAAKCQADYKLGVLTLKLSKPQTMQPQQIKITCD
ncbi:MAG: Hsp20/alpha crystallin family protein [Proteobacteria bacterium]|nr:Hsp20/alpha crystallin family protein [Pseudomonadota bacterium]